MKGNIVREIFLRCTPSLDIDLLPEGTEINSNGYCLTKSAYEQIIAEFCENRDEKITTHFYMLIKGPNIIEG